MQWNHWTFANLTKTYAHKETMQGPYSGPWKDCMSQGPWTHTPHTLVKPASCVPSHMFFRFSYVLHQILIDRHYYYSTSERGRNGDTEEVPNRSWVTQLITRRAEIWTNLCWCQSLVSHLHWPLFLQGGRDLRALIVLTGKKQGNGGVDTHRCNKHRCSKQRSLEWCDEDRRNTYGCYKHRYNTHRCN